MPTEDGFVPDHPLPLFLSGHADEPEQRGTSPILKASIVAVALTVSGVGVALWLGNPVKVSADARAPLTDNSAVQRGADPSTPATQSVADAQPVQSPADAQLSPPAAGGAPASDQIAGVPAPADQAETGNGEPSSDALFRQFQAWAAKEDAPAQQQQQQPVAPVQAAPAHVEENSPAAEQPVHKHRKPRSVGNAHAEIRHVQRSRARVQREQNARAQQAAPVQDARAQEQPAQTVQPPSFLQSLGLHQ